MSRVDRPGLKWKVTKDINKVHHIYGYISETALHAMFRGTAN